MGLFFLSLFLLAMNTLRFLRPVGLREVSDAVRYVLLVKRMAVEECQPWIRIILDLNYFGGAHPLFEGPLCADERPKSPTLPYVVYRLMLSYHASCLSILSIRNVLHVTFIHHHIPCLFFSVDCVV